MKPTAHAYNIWNIFFFKILIPKLIIVRNQWLVFLLSDQGTCSYFISD